MSQNDIVARLDRLESLDAIRQLAAKYSLALDMRDIDASTGYAGYRRFGKSFRRGYSDWQRQGWPRTLQEVDG